MGQPVRSILIAGGGLAGWLSAATCAKRLPGVRVTVVEDEAAPPSALDLYAGSRPQLRQFHARLGLNERNLLARTRSMFRLGQQLHGWAGDEPPYLRCFGGCGMPLGRAAFHQLWLRSRKEGRAAPFFDHSLAVKLVEAGRYAPPASPSNAEYRTFEAGLALDPGRYRDYLRAFAIYNGAESVEAEIVQIVSGGADRIGSVKLSDGRDLSADLFLDCTGPAARLFSTLPRGERRDDWRRWLPCDRILWGVDPPIKGLPLIDRAAAQDAGWLLQAPLPDRTISLRVEQSALSETAAPAANSVPLNQGRRESFWIGNCVALGDAAIELEPLGAPGLHLLSNALEWLLLLLPDTDFDPTETAEYNRKLILQADLVRDFVILHYATARRVGPFWTAAAAMELPPRLAETIEIFRSRGKILAREGEAARLEDWLSIFFGSGIYPEQVDPLTDAVPQEQFERLAAGIREDVARAVAAAPTHPDFLRTQLAG